MRHLVLISMCLGMCGGTVVAQDMHVEHVERLMSAQDVLVVLRDHEEQLGRRRMIYTRSHGEWDAAKQEYLVSEEQNDIVCEELLWDSKVRVTMYRQDEPTNIMTYDLLQNRELRILENNGSISSGQGSYPRTFDLTRTGTSSLASEFAKAGDDVTITPTLYNNKTVYAVSWNNDNWKRTVYLDPTQEWMPVMIENRMDTPPLLQDKGCMASVGRREITYVQMDTILVPKKVVLESFYVMADGSNQPRMRQTMEVRELSLLDESPASDVFRLNFPVGTNVWLADADAGYIEGGDPREIDRQMSKAVEYPSNGTPVQIVPDTAQGQGE